MTTRNKIGCGAGLLGTLAITWGGCYSLLSSKLDKGLVEQKLSKSLGVQVQIQQMHLNWQGSLHLDQVVLSTPKHAKFGELKSADAQIQSSELMHGQFNLTSLELSGFQVHLDPATLDELTAIPPASKARSYPISISQLTVDWSAGGQTQTKVFGPMTAKLPAQTQVGEIQVIAHGPAVEQIALERKGSGLHAKFLFLGTTPGSQAAESRPKINDNDILAVLQEQLGDSKIEGEMDYKDGIASTTLSGHYRTAQANMKVGWKAENPKEFQIEATDLSNREESFRIADRHREPGRRKPL